MAQKKAIQLSGDTLKTDYDEVKPQADKFMTALCEQLENLLVTNGITLGVPLECRVKTLDSISEKIERSKLSLRSVIGLEDLVGIRLILLFKRDLDKIHELMTDTFKVIRYEDTGSKLAETQFGYQSVHYVISLPNSWLKIPSLRDFGKFQAEVQVRTLAQHIWAAASHILQYKQESSVPPSVKRSIYRVSAVLETVDLEFERVLNERESYIAKVDTSREDIKLNVDLVERILDELLPAANKGPTESYGELIEDLLVFNIDTVGKLRQLIQSNLPKILKIDKSVVKSRREAKTEESSEFLRERVKRGVFYTHVGLTRKAASTQFGDEWEKYISKRYEYKERRSSK